MKFEMFQLCATVIYSLGLEKNVSAMDIIGRYYSQCVLQLSITFIVLPIRKYFIHLNVMPAGP